jgi:hypothetical protein
MHQKSITTAIHGQKRKKITSYSREVKPKLVDRNYLKTGALVDSCGIKIVQDILRRLKHQVNWGNTRSLLPWLIVIASLQTTPKELLPQIQIGKCQEALVEIFQ